MPEETYLHLGNNKKYKSPTYNPVKREGKEVIPLNYSSHTLTLHKLLKITC